MIQHESISTTLSNAYSFPEGPKFTEMHREDFAVLEPWFEKWNRMSPYVSMDFCDAVVQKFKDFHNLDNPDNRSGKADGPKEAHHSFTDYLYSDNVLPSLIMLHEWATIIDDKEALKKSSAALVVLNDAMDLLNNYAESQQPERDKQSGRVTQINRSAALARMMSETIDAKPVTFQFLTLMKIARLEARQCLWEYQSAPVDAYISPKIGTVSYKDQSRAAINEFLEAKNGIDVPESFIDRLIDPKTKALVISIDINSTFNTRESYTNIELLKKVNQLLKKLTKNFELNFHDEKKIFIVLNTGRPAHYFWGAVELGLEPIPEVRMIGLAEAGGAEIQSGMERGIATANVENPEQWKFELDEIKRHITSLVIPPGRFEEKLSMVSMEVKARNGHGEEKVWKHKSLTGEVVTDEWIRDTLKTYLAEKLVSLGNDFDKLREESSEMPEVNELLNTLSPSGPDGVNGTLDDVRADTINTLKEFVQEHALEVLDRISFLKKRQETLRIMQENLVVNFNPTAGFVDIMHRHQNKYSGLMRALGKYGLTYEDVATVHIGDAEVDKMPKEVDELGNLIPENEGADDVLLVGVHNSSDGLRDHIAERGDHGYITARDAASGVIDILEGFISAAQRAKEKELMLRLAR